MRKFVFGTVVLVVGLTVACADIIPSWVSAVPGQVGTLWSYTVNITVDQSAQAGDYFTIYDFGSIVPSSNLQPAGWVFSTSLLGTTPGQTNPPDNPNILNLIWTYTGAPIMGDTPAGQNIGPFQVEVPGQQTLTLNSFFAAQGTLISGPNSGSKIGNVGALVVPVPEPSTLALIIGTGGLGLVGRALSRRRR